MTRSFLRLLALAAVLTTGTLANPLTTGASPLEARDDSVLAFNPANTALHPVQMAMTNGQRLARGLPPNKPHFRRAGMSNSFACLALWKTDDADNRGRRSYNPSAGTSSIGKTCPSRPSVTRPVRSSHRCHPCYLRGLTRRRKRSTSTSRRLPQQPRESVWRVWVHDRQEQCADNHHQRLQRHTV